MVYEISKTPPSGPLMRREDIGPPALTSTLIYPIHSPPSYPLTPTLLFSHRSLSSSQSPKPPFPKLWSGSSGSSGGTNGTKRLRWQQLPRQEEVSATTRARRPTTGGGGESRAKEGGGGGNLREEGAAVAAASVTCARRPTGGGGWAHGGDLQAEGGNNDCRLRCLSQAVLRWLGRWHS